VTCGALDIPLVSDPDVLVAERYGAYRELHAIGPDEGALAWMREESGAPVQVDVGWVGGELLRLGPTWTVRILHVPGHSIGHLAIYDERSGALFSGDCLQGSVYLGLDGTPKLCPTYTHVDDYLATANLVESLAPRELHGCHWPPARGPEVGEFIAESRDYVEHVDRLVRACLAQPLTLDRLIDCVNRRLDLPWSDETAPDLVYSLHGHVARLLELGAATSSHSANGRVVYEMSSPA
jgi:glyoxylase-like metal-dependent hydrolase (beta-lactamase superfamily II)